MDFISGTTPIGLHLDRKRFFEERGREWEELNLIIGADGFPIANEYNVMQVLRRHWLFKEGIDYNVRYPHTYLIRRHSSPDVEFRTDQECPYFTDVLIEIQEIGIVYLTKDVLIRALECRSGPDRSGFYDPEKEFIENPARPESATDIQE